MVRTARQSLAATLAGAGLVVAFALLAYGNSLNAPFVYDDAGTIQENATIRRLRPLSGPLSPPATGNPMSGRPLVNLSLAANYGIGNLNPAGYHAFNLAIHIGCALLLFGIIRRTLNGRVGEHASLGIAVAATLLWTVHPLNSEPVDHISARTESLMALFYLLTFYAAIRAGQSRSHRPA